MVAIIMTYLAFLPGVQSPEDAVSDLAQQITRLGTTGDWTAAREKIEEFGLKQQALDARATEQLLELVQNNGIHGPLRFQILNLVCDKAAVDASGPILESMKTLSDLYQRRYPTGKQPRSVEEGSFYVPHLLRAFVKERLPSMEPRLPDPRMALDFYRTVALELDLGYRDIADLAAEGIVKCQAPLALKQQYAFELIQAQPSTVWPQAFHALMDRAFADRLRPILIRDAEDYVPFNGTALVLLSEYGDAQTADLLRAWAAGRADRDLAERRIGDRVWMIDAQREPQMIVEYIRSDGRDRAYASRAWALRKASELGVSHEELRSAVLALSQLQDGRSFMYASLIRVKHEAVKLGILQAGDLPYVIPFESSRTAFTAAVLRLQEECGKKDE